MKVLFIGGTGTISTAISQQLLNKGHELWLINRGSRNDLLTPGAHVITADIRNESYVAKCLAGQHFDVTADFIAYHPNDLERDYRLFSGRTKQFIYISSASAYQKPLSNYLVNEGTPLANPYWEYSRNKIAGEELLMHLYRQEDFPVTIVRPSHTYGLRSVPLGIHGKHGSFQVIKRMLEEKPVILHGDGTSLWTMTFNEDFAKGFIGLMGNARAIGEAVQITSDESLTWNQIYRTVADALQVSFKPYYVSSAFLAGCSDFDLYGGLLGDKANTVVFDNGKLKRLVPDFCASTRFDQGVRKVLDYVLSHPECQTLDPEFDHWCDRVIALQEDARLQIRREMQL